MEFHLGILPNRAIAQDLELARLAEALHLDGVWLADSHSVMRDPYVLLSVLATQTSRIKLATGVTTTVTRHPAVLANSWATLDELSGGRAILGIGVGESAVRNLGLQPEKLANFEEKIKVIRALLRGEAISYEGTTIRMPWSHYPVPVVIACSGPKSLQLAGRIGDGVLFQVGADPAFARYALEHIATGARESGRRLQDLKLYMRLACAVGLDADAARAQVRGYAAVAAGTVFKTVPRDHFDKDLWQELKQFKAHYDYGEHGRNEARHAGLLTDRIIDAVAIAGTADFALPRFRELAALGIDGFVCPVVMQDPGPYLQTLAGEVIAPLRELIPQ